MIRSIETLAKSAGQQTRYNPGVNTNIYDMQFIHDISLIAT